MAAVAVLSVIISSIMITYSRSIYPFMLPVLSFFEHKSRVHFLEKRIEEELDDHVVLIGAHRVGSPIVDHLESMKIPFVVLDFNPHVVEAMRERGIRVIYGDMGDPDILDSLQLEKAKLIISTAQDMEDNEVLLDECRKKRIRAKVVARALDHIHAKALKDLGAEYVILPEKVSGDFLVTQLKNHWPNIRFSGLE
jgi:voltage-gated potassium channel Kch